MLEHGEQPTNERIMIGDDCWLGVNVVVSPGVSIGQGAVVGANSVVTKDVAPYSVVAGSPALQIGHRLVWTPSASLDLTDPASLPYITGAETHLHGHTTLDTLATMNTVLHIATTQPGESAILRVDVLRPSTIVLNGSTVELGAIGPALLSVPRSASGASIHLEAPNDTTRLIAVEVESSDSARWAIVTANLASPG